MYTVIDGKNVDLGEAYGYCYRPEILSKEGREYSTLAPFDPDSKDWKVTPWLDSLSEASVWLSSRGLAGQVFWYAHHEAAQERKEKYVPWVTAGIAAKVEGKSLYEAIPEYRAAWDWAHRPKG